MRILLFLPVSCSNVLLQFFLGVDRRFYLVYVKLSAQHTGKFGALQLLLGRLGWARFSPSSRFLMRERHHLFVGEEGVALIQSLDNLELTNSTSNASFNCHLTTHNLGRENIDLPIIHLNISHSIKRSQSKQICQIFHSPS